MCVHYQCIRAERPRYYDGCDADSKSRSTISVCFFRGCSNRYSRFIHAHRCCRSNNSCCTGAEGLRMKWAVVGTIFRRSSSIPKACPTVDLDTPLVGNRFRLAHSVALRSSTNFWLRLTLLCRRCRLRSHRQSYPLCYRRQPPIHETCERRSRVHNTYRVKSGVRSKAARQGPKTADEG